MTRPEPPRLAAWLVDRILSSEESQRLLGDLGEEYTEFQCSQRGRWGADLWYWRQALGSVWILRHRGRRASDNVRAMRTGGGGLDSILQDVRYAVRKLWTAPTFAAAAVLTLALGIGATTAIFSVVNTVLLRSLPYSEPQRILRAWDHTDDGDIQDFSFRVVEYRELESHKEVFEAVGAEFPWSSTVLLPNQEPRQVQGRMLTPDFFRVFGTGPLLGRMFGTEEIAGGDAFVALVSYAFWTRYLGADPAAVGRTLDFAGTSYTLIGVLPQDYQHISGDEAEVFIPYTIGTSGWIAHWLDLYARLQPGVAEARAEEEINAVMAAIGQSDARSAGWHATVEPLHTMVVGDVRTAVWATFATVALVLLIACVNVANLTLARAGARVSEITIRRALGAGRRRIVRQLLVENLMLALAGGVVGVAAAFLGLRALVSVAPPSIPRLSEATIDPTVLTFSLVVTLTTGIVFGLFPAVRASRGGMGAALRQRSRTTTGGRRSGGLLGGLLVSEVALTLTLLVAAGLMVRTLQELQKEDLGFQQSGALTFRVIVPQTRWPGPTDTDAFYTRLRNGLMTLPGVTAVGAGTDLPVSGQGAVSTINSEERVRAGQLEGVTSLQRRATTGFFEALGTPLLAGRGFGSEDSGDSETTLVVSESLARRLFGDQRAVGRRVGFGNQPAEDAWVTVVGVVADIRYIDADRVNDPQFYQAHPQSAVRDMAVVVRTSGNPQALLEPAKEILYSIDPEIAMHAVTTLDALVDRALARQRFTMSLFSLFAGVALALTVAGIYGVLAFVVGRRRREMGVRMALGARSADVTHLVVREGMTLVTAGLVLGLIGALGASRLLGSLLYGVTASDPSTYVGVVAILAAVGLSACYLPARASSRVDPMTVLRTD